MEIWIRSQSRKSMLKTDNFYIDDSVQREEGYTYIKCCAYDEWLSIAKYDTKERALEVLDEIEDLMRSIQYSELKTFIYKMPKV